MVPALLELQDRGHEVAVRTLSSQVPAMEELGFDATPIAPKIETIEHDDWKATSPFAANRRVLRVFAERAQHEIADLKAAIEDFSPDALIIDISTEGAAAVADAGSLPWAHYTPYFVPLPSKHAPPFGLGLKPSVHAMGRARDTIIRRLLLDRLLASDIETVNAIRRSVGAPPLSNLGEQWLRAPLHLYFTAEPFEYPRPDWPTSFQLVGPGVWEPPADRPPWLAAIDQPLVLVSTSSEYQKDQKLVQTALDAFKDMDVTVVATTPSADPGRFSVPANARVERFIPHGPLLDRADCLVCHGGMGITQKALAAGVPVCVVPFGRDQLEVAGHVVASDCGTRVFPQLLSARRLRRAVQAAIAKKDGAARVARDLADAGGPVAAAESLEGLLAS